MKTILLISALAGLLTQPLMAGTYQLKNRSHFAIQDDAHNPFWPIGWVKPAPGVANAPKAAPLFLKPESFSVSSISISAGAKCAVVNGKVYGEGEGIPASIDNRKVLVRLVAIKDGGVVIGFGGQGIIVPLKRKEDQALNRTFPIGSAQVTALEN